ncbi:MAG: folate-binding protein YgfZ [Hyphomonas sp.]|uniref:CAF17-like 4Fe-4S cluster assembly/insertion protein YgfZ n=1 Tax=Hyphomonas sp. TaxID=87 RepID=UPI00185D4CAA|nr:folate-binding protein [Hyphomonas sp.]MBU3919850.1 folate-binding protein [Alphaproteobacteria bacterium]MBA3067089.1 folate-binding protein YgfZ [Hyphomonas sp.]MBU4063115.1 folate-binding protein [Alphaproteobacteria bacterium]MBU4164432.1 folate-binding protein [Alphaproteobacteria bacterium]MBU4567598.1 folate-binding protein [Alphaproteobacteria bacterium]
MLRLPNRAILRLTGPDTLALLERTVTHTVADWREGEARYGALLTPQGKVIADYIAHRTADGVLIDVHEDAAEDLLKRLTMFRLRADVEIVRDEELASVSDETGEDDPRSARLFWRGVVPIAEVTREVDPAIWQAKRLAAGVSEWGEDYRAGEVFPTDINMDRMDGIDYKKGCFVGQEVASRMKRRGKIRKRTIRILGSTLIKGALVIGGAEVGTITSADAQGTRGLALVRLDRLRRAIGLSLPFTSSGGPVSFEFEPWTEDEMAALAEEGADE